jgi:TonB family protein
MGKNEMNWGLCISIILHILLLGIPLTTTGVREFSEIELFVMEEKPAVPGQRFMARPKPASISKATEKEVVKEADSSLIPAAIEEKKAESEIVMESKKDEIEDVLEQRSEPVSPPALTFIPSDRERKDAGGESRKEVSEPITLPTGIERLPSGSRKMETDTSEQAPSPVEEVGFGSKESPRFLRREMPIYPLMARKLGKDGKVILRLTIDEKGNLLNVEVIEKGGYGFTEAAMEAVKKSTFLPAKKDGKPIASRALLPIRFQLERN